MAINYRHTALAGLLLTGVVTFLTSCKEGDAIFSDINHPEADYVLEDKNDLVTVVTLALNVSSKQDNATRLPVDIVQQLEEQFRGLQDFQIVPFAVADPTASPDPITATDTPVEGSVSSLSRRENTYNYIDEQTVDATFGTNAYLCYAKARPSSTSATKFSDGSTLPDYTTMTPQAITFSPDVICADTSTAVSAAQALTGYLTAIANSSYNDGATTTYWRESSNTRLKSLFDTFINNVNGEEKVIAGSSANVLALVDELYQAIATLNFNQTDNPTEYGIRQDILTNIASSGVFVSHDTTDPTLVTGVDSLPTSMRGFPASVNLPDGAAALKWNNTSNAFELQTTSTTMDPISGMTQFVYPAELFYYANSPIKTSNTSQSPHYSIASWATVLGYYTDNNVVDINTRSIAINDPLNYGVGCLQAYVWSNSATLTDADYTNIELETIDPGTGTTHMNFPLTGFLLGGQYKQLFDFTPDPAAVSTDSEGIIYDKTIGKSIYLAAATDSNGDGQPDNPSYFYTLSLQTVDESSVKIILEFQNNSTQTFRGNDGLVFPGTKFYLIGTISAPLNERVMTKDHVTKIGIRINSLADAYNVIPDMLTVTHEFNVVNIGITKWDDTSTGTKNIYNW